MMVGIGMGFGVIGLILMLVFWGGLIALAASLVKSIFPAYSSKQGRSTKNSIHAQEILDQRYARGDLTRAEYEIMKEDLL